MVNVKKCSTEPASLRFEKAKSSGSYRKVDVINQIKIDFSNKCYLCEDKNLTNINIEHFIPHKGDVEKKFSWKNLFLCCGHCNNIKGSDIRFDNILDCTDSAYNVLELIKLTINPFPFERVIVEPMVNDDKTKNTAILLREIYNGTTPLKLLESENLRNKLIREIIDFQSLLFEYFDDTLTLTQKLNLKEHIRRKLSTKAPFTAFKVWIIKNNPTLLLNFNELI